MEYQLVVQLSGNWAAHMDLFARLEQEVIDALDLDVEVECHELGLDQATLFIVTDDPGYTFEQMLPVLQRFGVLESGTLAAVREIGEEGYEVIWPEDFDEY